MFKAGNPGPVMKMGSEKILFFTKRKKKEKRKKRKALSHVSIGWLTHLDERDLNQGIPTQ